MFRHCTIFASGSIAVCMASAHGSIIEPENLLENGGFEVSPHVGSWSLFDSIPGWASSDGTKIEIQKNVNGWLPAEGAQYVELDSVTRAGGHGIYQDVSTIAGEVYDFSIWFSPRPGVGDNQLQILWDGAIVGEYSASGSGKSNTDWQFIELQLGASSDLSRIEFRNADPGDSLGTFVDGASLSRVVPTPGSGVIAALAGFVATRRRR